MNRLSFNIKVAGFQNQQQVHLPLAAAAYSAVIGEITADHSFSPLVTADTIHVPRKNPVPVLMWIGAYRALNRNHSHYSFLR
jgi:hypothetical protein